MAGGNKRTGPIGAAGEYHVAVQLSQRNWLATITIKNSPGTDVLAQHVETGVVVAIQTRRRRSRHRDGSSARRTRRRRTGRTPGTCWSG